MVQVELPYSGSGRMSLQPGQSESQGLGQSWHVILVRPISSSTGTPDASNGPEDQLSFTLVLSWGDTTWSGSGLPLTPSRGKQAGNEAQMKTEVRSRKNPDELGTHSQLGLKLGHTVFANYLS